MQSFRNGILRDWGRRKQVAVRLDKSSQNWNLVIQWGRDLRLIIKSHLHSLNWIVWNKCIGFHDYQLRDFHTLPIQSSSRKTTSSYIRKNQQNSLSVDKELVLTRIQVMFLLKDFEMATIGRHKKTISWRGLCKMHCTTKWAFSTSE